MDHADGTVSFREWTKKHHLGAELSSRDELFPLFYYLLLPCLHWAVWDLFCKDNKPFVVNVV